MEKKVPLMSTKGHKAGNAVIGWRCLNYFFRKSTMLRKIMTATILAAAAMGVNAEDFYLKPVPKGMEMNLPVTVKKSFPNDKARIVFSTMSEAKDLATAQSEVNKTMAEAQQSVKDFSSIAKIRNGGYYTQPIYTNPKKGEAPVITGWRARQNIIVETEDVNGVASLVQVGQQAKLVLENVSYSLSEEAKAAAQDQLSKDVIDALNKKAESIAVAMKVAPDALRIEKLNFNSFDFAPEGAVFAARAMGANAAFKTVETPVFEAGTSNLSMSVSAVLKTEGAE